MKLLCCLLLLICQPTNAEEVLVWVDPRLELYYREIGAGFRMWEAVADVKFRDARLKKARSWNLSVVPFSDYPFSRSGREVGGYRWGSIYVDTTRPSRYMSTMIAHEYGHYLGLPDSRNPWDIMYYRDSAAKRISIYEAGVAIQRYGRKK